MSDGRPVRVALVGASGIGKHHAKWWALEGAEVRAFVGTSPASVARTRETLEGLFGFSGTGYTGLDELLAAEAPDIVDVCSPPAFHMAHATTALEAGCDVLCEKPLFFDPSLPPEAMLDQAGGLIALARDRGRRLGVCTQYTAGADVFGRVWRERGGDAAVTAYHGHLESPAKGRDPDPHRVWVDLSPHLLSALIQLFPDGEADWTTLATRFKGYEACASFELRRPAAPTVHCDLVTRNATRPPLHTRHFKLDGYPFTVEGEKDGQGVYAARIETPDGDVHEPDMMRVVIRAMIAGRALASGRAALLNLEWMLRILEAARSEATQEGGP